jgi:hypothetical protein
MIMSELHMMPLKINNYNHMKRAWQKLSHRMMINQRDTYVTVKNKQL